MAQIKVEEVIDHLASEMKRALEDAVTKVIPNAQFNRDELYREFRRAVYSKCNIWESIPDQYVRAK
ncbi:MAG TPA: hypothetical protein VGO47_10725 [Chlamydiales bacterium]|jgi:hypothetical protein|nr:hypothetical protein [Chlamydiales bacterium]